VADLLDSIRRELRKRLDELRPLVSEYERLAAAAQALDSGAGADSQTTGTGGKRSARRRRRRSTATRQASTPAERQANRERVLAVLGERPGVSRAELKQVTGLSGAGVAQHLRRLIEGGEVVEERLPSGEAGYRRRAADGARAREGDRAAAERAADAAASSA
jgi:hypothetical protein